MEGSSFLESLPVELLTYIHLLSLSSTLPFVSRSLHNIFTSSSNHHKATYLKFRHNGTKLLSKSLKYGICTLPVLRRLEELVIREMGEKKGREILKLEELPRRLIKYLKRSNIAKTTTTTTTTTTTNFQVDLPFIYYLLSHYSASPNSQKGYWLAKAVVESHYALTKMLLRFGGDPSLKDGYAVVLAIGNKDLEMVRLLLERGRENEDDRDEIPSFELGVGDQEQGEEEVEMEVKGVGGKRRRSSLGGSSAGGGGGGGGSAERLKVKRRKMGITNERCAATPAMLEVAAKAKEWSIFKYLVGRGAIPSMEVIKLMDNM